MLHEKGFTYKERRIAVTLKLKRSESFYIREGWIEKAINAIKEADHNIFTKNEGVRYLGIGSNMVKGLKYWLKAADIIKDSKFNELTEFGNALYMYDRYMDSKFSWYFVHYFLSTNKEDCPIFYFVFAQQQVKQFTKNELTDFILEQYSEEAASINRKNLEADVNTFVKSYVTEEIITNPENNYACPLASLNLLKKTGNKHSLCTPSYKSLNCLVVYYALTQLYQNSFVIEESMEKEKSPFKIFNLDKYLYLQYLEEMRKMGLVTINKTAGLNTVYIEEHLSLNQVFEKYFGDVQ